MYSDKQKDILALEKMINNAEKSLKRRLSNNGQCSVTKSTRKEIDRWILELSKLKDNI